MQNRTEDSPKKAEITLIFDPVSGGGHVQVDRAPVTSVLLQVVLDVLKKLGVQQPRNITVQNKSEDVLDLNLTLAVLGLSNGDRLRLAWQLGGGSR